MYDQHNAKRYTGTKSLQAWKATRGEYNQYRGWVIPSDEDPNEAGYLVEYEPDGKSNHPNHKGYISWTPADVFERSYRMTDPEEIASIGTDISMSPGTEGQIAPEGEHMVANPYLSEDQKSPTISREHRDRGDKDSETGAEPGEGPSGDEPLGKDVKSAKHTARETTQEPHHDKKHK